MGWKYYAQRIVSGEILHAELPLSDVRIARVRNGAMSLRANLDSSRDLLLLASQKHSDGLPVLHPWATWILAEDSAGTLRYGGPLTRPVLSTTSGVEAGGVTSWLRRQYWTGPEYRKIQEDPATIIRDLVAGTSAADLGIRVTGATSTPIRVGTEPEEVSFTTESGEDVAFTAHNDGPYLVLRHEGVNIGEEIQSLCSVEPPLEYEERVSWVDRDAGTVRYDLHLAYPRLGRRRHDITFDTSYNAVASVQSVGEGNDYANTVVGIGRGEGLKGVFVVEESRPSLVPPVMTVLEDKSATASRMRGLAKAKASAVSVPFHIPRVTVRHSQIGTWSLGDDVYTTVRNSSGVFSQWCRVVSEDWSPDTLDVAELTLAPSESFSYGSPV